MQKVLIVDDMASVRANLAACLEGMPVQLSFAEDGAAALRLLKSERFDLALLDLQMPVLDGPQLLRLLRGTPLTTDFIFVTATSSRAALAELFKMGVSDYIAKPFKKEEVREKVERVLSRRRRAAGTATRSTAALGARLSRELLVVIADPGIKAAIAALLPSTMAALYADDATSAVRSSRLFKFQAILVDPLIPGLEWKAIATIQPGALVFTLGHPGTLAPDDVLPSPPETLQPILDAMGADAGQVTVGEDGVVTLQPGGGSLTRSYRRASDLLSEAIEKVTARGSKGLIVDLIALGGGGDRLVQLVRQASEWTSEADLRLLLIGTDAIKDELIVDPTASAVPFFEDRDLARESLRYFDEESA